MKFQATQDKHVFDLLSESNCKSVLNIGYRKGSREEVKNFLISQGGTFSVLEIWEPCIKEISKMSGISEIFNIDVSKIKTLNRSWDAIIWLHGPEHVKWDDFLKIKGDIESCCQKLIIYQAPIGSYPQGAREGNPYEAHLATLTPEMFEKLGYQTKYPLEATFSAWKIFNK